MKFLIRKSKLLLIMFALFVITYTAVNLFDLRSSSSRNFEIFDYNRNNDPSNNGAAEEPVNLGENDHPHRHHHHKPPQPPLPPHPPERDSIKENQELSEKNDDFLVNELKDSSKEKEKHNKEDITEKPAGGIIRKDNYLAYDGGGFGGVNTGKINCGNELTVQVVGSSSMSESDFSYFHMSAPSKDSLAFKDKRHFSMVYTMESEPHSHGGESWSNADFRMWYNLDLSFPEPATYFDVKMHLRDLLSPPSVNFDDKEKTGNIVWVVSNCNAFNGRQNYMKRLMDVMSVHSYGGCLKNKNSHPGEHMKGNIELFSKYKFVIAIENSNCQDYVTEKLVHAVASGSIPIVAGKDDKPDYLKFMPKNSYINIYDFKSPQELAKHIELVASKREEYQKYIQFKFNHNYTREYLNKLTLEEIIKVSKTVIDPAEKFFSELVLKEKSENKLCKVARYLRSIPDDVKEHEIEARKINRPSVDKACLKPRNLDDDFKKV